MLQREPHPEERAANYVKGDVKDVEDALKGARDIIAEHVSEDERAETACATHLPAKAHRPPRR